MTTNTFVSMLMSVQFYRESLDPETEYTSKKYWVELIEKSITDHSYIIYFYYLNNQKNHNATLVWTITNYLFSLFYCLYLLEPYTQVNMHKQNRTYLNCVNKTGFIKI